MKKKGWILVLAFAAGAILFLNTPERRTKGYFRIHQEELTQAVSRWQRGEELGFDPRLTGPVNRNVKRPLSSSTSASNGSSVNASTEFAIFSARDDTAAQIMSFPYSSYPACPSISIPAALFAASRHILT